MEKFNFKRNKLLTMGTVLNTSIEPLFHEIITAGVSSLDDLYEKYTLFEAFQLYVIILTNAYNAMKIQENGNNIRRQQ